MLTKAKRTFPDFSTSAYDLHEWKDHTGGMLVDRQHKCTIYPNPMRKNIFSRDEWLISLLKLCENAKFAVGLFLMSFVVSFVVRNSSQRIVILALVFRSSRVSVSRPCCLSELTPLPKYRAARVTKFDFFPGLFHPQSWPFPCQFWWPPPSPGGARGISAAVLSGHCLGAERSDEQLLHPRH